LNNGLTELPREEELEYEDMAQNSIQDGRAAMPLALNKEHTKGNIRWDQRFKELVDFKKMNGHTNVPRNSGPLGAWICMQRIYYRAFERGTHSSRLTIDKFKKLERIGFQFNHQTHLPWDNRFQDLVDFKKINGHTNVPSRSGPLGRWVSIQRSDNRFLQEGKDSKLTIEKRKKLESIGFEFKPNKYARNRNEKSI
jgi:hypothetical protein